MIEQIISYTPLLVGIVGGLALVINVIVELTKNIGALKKVPTDLYVLILGVVLSLLTFFIYTSIAELSIEWWMVVAVFIAGFIVAYVAMYGWEKFNELKDRFTKQGVGGSE